VAKGKGINMDEEYAGFPEYSKEDLDQAFDEAFTAAKRLHTKITTLAEDTGYMVNVISSAKLQLDELFERAKTDPSVYPFVASGIDYLRGLSGELNTLNDETVRFTFQFGPAVNSTGTFAGTTDSGEAFWNPKYELKPFSPPPNRKTREHYSDELKELNSTLADSYNQVWQTYFGTSSEPHRAALFMMRTLFDNFFAWLGPDEEVRKSKYWHRKDSDKPNQIWRSERLAFALEKNIKDSNRRAVLEAESKQINALYKAANEAHNRGSLDEDKASKTLLAMDSFLNDWIDSLN
jgi:hypothetical protein